MGDDGNHALVSRALEALEKLPRPRYSSWLIEEAITQVDPAAHRLADFKREFDFAVVRIGEHVPMESWAPASRTQDTARAIANAAESLLKHLSEVQQPLAHYLSNGTERHKGHVDIQALLVILKPLAEEARFHANSRVEKDGAPPRSPAKEYAVEAAHRLICAFARRKPSNYKEGPFFVVSEILYKAATKQRKADLSRYCRDFLQKQRTNGG